MTGRRFEQLCAIAGPVSRETFPDLLGLAEMLAQWNERINLVAPSTVKDVWERHILDSAQVFGLGKPGRWADLGSGGGFPGLVLAVLMKGSASTIELVESNRKKAAFLQAAAARFKLPAKVCSERIEVRVGRQPRPDIVTARALAALPELLSLTAPWLTQGSTALFHKGREYRAEIEESRQHWQFDLVEHPSKIDAGGAILEVSRLRPAL